MTVNRQAAGTPAGGRFAPHVSGEAPVELAGDDPGDVERPPRPSTKPLTRTDAVAVYYLVDAVNRGAKVARVDDHGTVVIGTARSIGDEGGNYAGPDDDIRDCLLRVTTTTGFEAFWPVSDLMDEVRSGQFLPDYHE